METAIRITLVLHLLGFASIMAGTLSQMSSFKTGAKVLPSILHGSWLSLVTGLAMAGMLPANGEHVNPISISVKSVGITAIFFIAYTYNKKENTPKWVVPTILLLAIVNVVIAVVLGMTTE
jgi:peptidoglycan/LPS O-acetylase OafA/YrhL